MTTRDRLRVYRRLLKENPEATSIFFTQSHDEHFVSLVDLHCEIHAALRNDSALPSAFTN